MIENYHKPSALQAEVLAPCRGYGAGGSARGGAGDAGPQSHQQFGGEKVHHRGLQGGEV